MLAVDRETEGTALIIHGKDEASMQLLRDKLVEFAKLDANPDRLKQGSYRDIDVQQVDKIAFAAVGPRLVFTNQKDLGKDILDRMLDGGESLADQARYRTARKRGKHPCWLGGTPTSSRFVMRALHETCSSTKSTSPSPS